MTDTNRFTIVESLDEELWNRFVYEHPKGSIFHTSYMVDVFSKTKKNRPLFLAAIDRAGEVLALLASVRVQTLAGPLSNMASRSIFYAEPIGREDALGAEALEALVKEHDARMRGKALFTEVRPLCSAGPDKTALERCGYQHEEYLNFLVDLRKPADALWSLLSNTCRANIRRGQKQGVRVEDATSEEGVDILYHLLQTTYEAARVPLADKSLFAEALKTLQPRDMIKVFVAYHEDAPVAASMVLLYKKNVFDWYWGVQRTKSIYPAECITWRRIQWAQEQGRYDLFDFGGAGWPNKPYGVRDFKAKFGGEMVNYGRYRKIYSPRRFMLAERAYDLARGMVKPKPPSNYTFPARYPRLSEPGSTED